MQYMRQVELVRKTDGGFASSIGWIKEALAKIGNYVKFEDDIDTIVWKVRNVYSRQEMDYVEKQEEAQRDFVKKLSRKLDRG